MFLLCAFKVKIVKAVKKTMQRQKDSTSGAIHNIEYFSDAQKVNLFL